MQVAIMLYPGCTALDFVGPYEVLRWLPGAEPRFVWHAPGPIVTDEAVLTVGATHSFAETPAPDIIVVPGGMTTMAHATNPEVLNWLRSAHESASWTTSVCSGSIILAAAGLLTGRPATSHWGALKTLRMLGAKPVADQRIVETSSPQGRPVVTSAGVSAGIDMALWLAGEVGGARRARSIQLVLEYDPEPPYDSGHASKADTATKAEATALLVRGLARPGLARAARTLWWPAALDRARRWRPKWLGPRRVGRDARAGRRPPVGEGARPGAGTGNQP